MSRPGPTTRPARTPGRRSSTPPAAEFADQGYDASLAARASRAVAGVDPALVHHYFDGKAHLFAETMALPVRPADVIAGVLSGPRAEVGERLAVGLLHGLGRCPRAGSGSWPWCARRSATSEAARMLREFLAREVFGRLARERGSRTPELRGWAGGGPDGRGGDVRYVVGYEPLVAADPARLAALVAPSLQRYLVDPDG